MSALETVQDLKSSLSKELHLGDDKLDDAAIERCEDILKRLDECDMSLSILSSTLIGVTVSKLKRHVRLGPLAKGLVKKWKQAARPKKKSEPTERPERRAASKDDACAEQAADLPPLRQNSWKKLKSLLELSKNDFQTSPQAFENLCVSCATDIEAAVQNLHPHDPRAYREKALSLCFNLKKNAALRSDLLFGSVTADELVALSSHALATAETRAARQERVARLQDSRLLDWEQRHEGKINEICGIKDDLLQASLFTCGRCKSIKTTSTQKQTRSADEPMTVFVLCLNCGNRWKC